MGGAASGVGGPGHHPAAGLGVLGRYWWLRGTVAGPASARCPQRGLRSEPTALTLLSCLVLAGPHGGWAQTRTKGCYFKCEGRFPQIEVNVSSYRTLN